MHDHDEICLCFHVTQAKLKKHLRNYRLQRASQLSECFGAGTGCGWCRPYLRELFEQQSLDSGQWQEMTAEKYAQLRQIYLDQDQKNRDQA